jgi:hypothetical protein
MDNHITILYKTPAGTIWSTLNEALIAHRIEIAPVYLSSYDLKNVVVAACISAPEESLGSIIEILQRNSHETN